MRRKKPAGEDGYSYICALCEDFGELLCCERCRQGFHLACIGLESFPDGDSWLCSDCSQNKVRCFDCKEYGSFKENAYRCGVGLCGKLYHSHCIEQWERPQPKGRSGIVCPHHYCDVCWNIQSHHAGNDQLYRCLKCPTAYHEFCMPDSAGLLEDIPGFMLCTKHNEGWKCQNDDNAPTGDVKVGFDRLPLPSVPQDFKLPVSLKVAVRRLQNRPPPYVHIRRNIYLVKKPRKKSEEENMQCSCHASEGSTGACDKDCLCGMLLTSCSTSCKCGDACANLPFQKRPGRKMKAVKTEQCGWGLKADEDVKAGDFLVEYVGEVIDDETCEKRLWAMKEQGESNFYMCEISREIVIDATFKGNLSRFINHSCSPNSELQKWEIEGEIRIGVFATKDINKGEYVNYDYQFIQFGTDQLCHCGASGCRRQLGKPQKQKASTEFAIKSVEGEEALPSRPSRRSNLYSSFSIERRFTPINGVFRHQRTSIVVRADVHYMRTRRENCVGLRVKVWWPLDQKFYHGKITRYDPKIGKHQIMYDDGQEEDLLMTKERWEVEKKLPLRRKRSNSPVLDETSSEPPVSELNGSHSPVLKWKRGRSPTFGQKNGQLPTLEQTKAQSPTVEQMRAQSPTLELNRSQSATVEREKDQAPTLEWKRSSEPPVSDLNGGQSPVLKWKRGRSPTSEQNRGQLPTLEQTRAQSPALELNRSQSATVDREKDQAPTLERKRSSEAPVSDLNGGQSPVLKWKRGRSPTSEQNRGQLPTLEQTRAQSPALELNRSQSPTVDREKDQAPTFERKRSSEPPVSELNGGQSPVLKWKRGRSPTSEQNRSQLPTLEQTRAQSPTLEQAGSQSPALELNRSQSPTVEQTMSQSFALELNRSQSHTVEQMRAQSPTLELNRSQSHTVEQMRAQSPTLELKRNQSPTVEQMRAQSPTLELNRCQSLTVEQTRAQSPTLELNRSQSPALDQAPTFEQNRGQLSTLEQTRAQSPTLELNRSQPSSVARKKHEAATWEWKRTRSRILQRARGQSSILLQNRSQSPVQQGERDNSRIMCKHYTRQRVSHTVETAL